MTGDTSMPHEMSDDVGRRQETAADVAGLFEIALRAAASDVTYASELLIEVIRTIKVEPDLACMSQEARAVIDKNPHFFGVLAEIRRDLQTSPNAAALINDLYVQCLVCVATLPPPKRKKASIKAARELCGIAASYIEAGQTVPGPLRPYVANALNAISQGKDAGSALKTNRGSGNQNDSLDGMKRNRIVAKRVRQVIAQRGWEDEPERAYSEVADEITKGRGEFASPVFAGVVAFTSNYIGKMYRSMSEP